MRLAYSLILLFFKVLLNSSLFVLANSTLFTFISTSFSRFLRCNCSYSSSTLSYFVRRAILTSSTSCFIFSISSRRDKIYLSLPSSLSNRTSLSLSASPSLHSCLCYLHLPISLFLLSSSSLDSMILSFFSISCLHLFPSLINF